MQALLAGAPKIGESLCAACREHFERVREYLDTYGVRYELTPTLVRGLDYYTRTTFEFKDEAIGAKDTICGGGRYDGLIEEIGGPPTPGIGFGAGIERLLLSIGAERAAPRARRRLLRVRGRRGPRPGPAAARRATAARAAGGHGLRRPVGQGTAHPGRPPRRGLDRDRGTAARQRSASRAVPTSRRRSTSSSTGSPDERLARPVCRRRPCPITSGKSSPWRAGSRADETTAVSSSSTSATTRASSSSSSTPSARPRRRRSPHDIRSEFVVRAQGEVVRRAPDAVNPNIPTGEVELQVDELEIVSRSEPLPFQIDDEGVEEPIRLRYRYLDLRRDRMQRNLRLSATVIAAIRRSMEEQGFIDVLDSVDDARHAGGRARLSHPDAPTTRAVLRARRSRRSSSSSSSWSAGSTATTRSRRAGGTRISVPTGSSSSASSTSSSRSRRARTCSTSSSRSSSRRSRRSAARRRHGRSRACRMPTRCCATAPTSPTSASVWRSRTRPTLTRDSQFGVFANAETVRYLVAPKSFSRGELQKLEEFAKEWGAKGLAYLVFDEAGEVRSPIAKFLSERRARGISRAARLDRPLRRGQHADGGAGPRRPASPPRPAARPRRRVAGRVPLGARLPAVPEGRGHGPVDVRPSPVHEPGSPGTRT